jgi:hypothetical protein
MVRTLRWMGALGLLSLLAILWFGRFVTRGCSPPLTGPCDPVRVTPHWTLPVFVAVLAISVVLLVFAAIVSHRRAEGDSN